MPLLIVPFMTVTYASSSTTMSSTFSAQSYFKSLVTILDIYGLAEVEENDSNDSLACDDNAHKVIICAHSLILCV